MFHWPRARVLSSWALVKAAPSTRRLRCVTLHETFYTKTYTRIGSRGLYLYVHLHHQQQILPHREVDRLLHPHLLLILLPLLPPRSPLSSFSAPWRRSLCLSPSVTLLSLFLSVIISFAHTFRYRLSRGIDVAKLSKCTLCYAGSSVNFENVKKKHLVSCFFFGDVYVYRRCSCCNSKLKIFRVSQSLVAKKFILNLRVDFFLEQFLLIVYLECQKLHQT